MAPRRVRHPHTELTHTRSRRVLLAMLPRVEQKQVMGRQVNMEHPGQPMKRMVPHFPKFLPFPG